MYFNAFISSSTFSYFFSFFLFLLRFVLCCFSKRLHHKLVTYRDFGFVCLFICFCNHLTFVKRCCFFVLFCLGALLPCFVVFTPSCFRHPSYLICYPLIKGAQVEGLCYPCLFIFSIFKLKLTFFFMHSLHFYIIKTKPHNNIVHVISHIVYETVELQDKNLF